MPPHCDGGAGLQTGPYVAGFYCLLRLPWVVGAALPAFFPLLDAVWGFG
jgi:hypothetical protein